MDRILRFINCNEEIKKAVPQFKEAFIKFYGEEYRSEIEDKFNNLLCIGYQQPECIEMGIRKIEYKKTEELLTPIFEKTNIPLKSLIGSGDFRYKSIMPITYLCDIYDFHKLGKEGRKQAMYEDGFNRINQFLNMTREEYDEFYKTKELPERFSRIPEGLKEDLKYLISDTRAQREYDRYYKNAECLLQELIPEINADNYDELLDNPKIEELVSAKEKVENAYQEYQEYIKGLKDYYDEADSIEKLKNTTKDTNYKEYIKENIDLLPESKRENIEKYLNGQILSIDKDVKNILSESLEFSSNLECFSKESDELLNNKAISSWQTNTIKENRVKYFKAMGLDLGNEYDSYINNQEAKKLVPSKERIQELIESRNKYLNKYNNTYYNFLERHKKIMEEINNIDFVDKEVPINARMYVQGNSFISPNYIETDAGCKAYPILSINFSNFNDNSIDHTIVHELNHVMETSLGLIGEDEYEIFCGWEVLKEKRNTIQSEEVDTLQESDKRSYELFNEIINEVIAKGISKIMHEENIFIFDDKNDSKYKGTTSYEHSTFLINDFFNEFREDIIKSRHNGNIEVIFNSVGKENFDELNSLFDTYFKHFGGTKIYNLYKALDKKEDNEQTRVYYDLCEKRDKILDKMRLHNANNKTETKEASL